MALFVCTVVLKLYAFVIKGVLNWYVYKIEVGKWKK